MFDCWDLLFVFSVLFVLLSFIICVICYLCFTLHCIVFYCIDALCDCWDLLFCPHVPLCWGKRQCNYIAIHNITSCIAIVNCEIKFSSLVLIEGFYLFQLPKLISSALYPHSVILYSAVFLAVPQTFREHPQRATIETCHLRDILPEWWGDILKERSKKLVTFETLIMCISENIILKIHSNPSKKCDMGQHLQFLQYFVIVM